MKMLPEIKATMMTEKKARYVEDECRTHDPDWYYIALQCSTATEKFIKIPRSEHWIVAVFDEDDKYVGCL